MADVRALRPDSLGAVVDIAMQKHAVTSGRALAKRASDLGIPTSHTVLNKLRSGTYTHPLGREQRESLAALSGVPLRVINELAGARDLPPFDLPERAAELTGEQRNAVLHVVGAFIAANEALAAAEGATIDDVPQAAAEERRPDQDLRESPGVSTDPYIDGP